MTLLFKMSVIQSRSTSLLASFYFSVCPCFRVFFRSLPWNLGFRTMSGFSEPTAQLARGGLCWETSCLWSCVRHESIPELRPGQYDSHDITVRASIRMPSCHSTLEIAEGPELTGQSIFSPTNLGLTKLILGFLAGSWKKETLRKWNNFPQGPFSFFYGDQFQIQRNL